MASIEPTDLSINMATPPQEQAIQTSSANPVNASNVPMSLMAQPTPAVNLPPAPVVPSDTTVLSEGGQIMDGFAKQKEAEATQAQQKYSASEQSLREQFGILGTESQARTQLEDKVGVNAYSQDLTRFQESLRRQMADLDQFDLDNVNTIESMRVDAGKRDITKRTFSAMSAEANIQMAVQRAGKVASTRATIAAIDVTQGNLKGATEQVDKALKAVYDPIRMSIQMESQFLQNNMQMFTAAQSSAANARMKVMEQEVAEIERATVNVDAAVASGYATADDIETMTGLSGKPKEQSTYANKILAKASRAEVARQEAQVAASRSASAWSQRASAYELAMNGDPTAIDFLGFDPRTANMTMQDTFNYVNETMEDDRILTNLEKAVANDAAIDASTGVAKLSLLTSAARYGGPSLLAGGAAGSVVPGVGTAIGSFGGFVAGTAGGYAKVANDKKDMLGALSALSNTAAFTKLREYKEAGMTFGALTEGERIAIGRAAGNLFAALDVEDDGTVTGINVSAKRYKELVAEYQKETEIKKQQKAQIYSGLNTADEELINGL